VPELPDVDLYVSSLADRVIGQVLEQLLIHKPFLLRSVDPPIADADGRRVVAVRRMGKRIVIGLEGERWLILHLMIAGRLRWTDDNSTRPGRNQLATFVFSSGTLKLTEAGSKKRASLFYVSGKDDLALHDPGGLEPLTCSFGEFRDRLSCEQRTLKRALTNPKIFSGIGNAYSDEILHAARLSPFKLCGKLDDGELRRLFDATRSVLGGWSERLRREAAGKFPGKVTAFHPGMAVHGKFGQPCPICNAPVQRIRYKSNETNYCARCQTGGRVLADRALSRLLKSEWPDSLDE
jgi:formamidopyrimidine-DNA glycosylase